MRNPAILLATLVLLIGLVVMRESRQQPGSEIEAGFLNWLAATADMHPATTPKLSLVEIDDNCLTSKHPWPWAPLDYALFLQASLELGPAVVAIEEVLNWDASSQTAQKNEQSLYNLILKTPKVLLAGKLGSLEDPDLVPPFQHTPILQKVNGPKQLVPEYSVISQQPKQEFRLTPELGFTNLPSGPVIQSIPLLFRYRGEMVPSFVLQALMLWLKLTPDEIQVDLGKEIRLGNQRAIPIDSSGAMLLNLNAQFHRVGYDDLLLLATVNNQHPPEALRPGGLFLLGRTDKQSRVYRLPDSTQVSSSELFAMAISTVGSQQFVRRTPFYAELGLIAFAMLCARWFLRLESRSAWLCSLACLAVYLLMALALFTEGRLVLPLLLPMTLAVFMPLFRNWHAGS